MRDRMPKRSGPHPTGLPVENRLLPEEQSELVPGYGEAVPQPSDDTPDSPRGRGPRTGRIRIRHNAKLTTYNVTTQLANQQVAPDDPNRAYLGIQNRGTNAVFISFGEPASTRSFRLVAGAFYEPYIPPSTSINILSQNAGENVVIIEGVYPGEL